MPILLGLLNNRWVWIALAFAIVTGYGGIEHARFMHETAKYEAEHTAFLTFQNQVKIVAEAAQQAADAKAKQQENNVKQLEAQNVESQKAITGKYERFIASLRKSIGHSDSNQMPAPAVHATVCSSDAANKRLSDALEQYRADVQSANIGRMESTAKLLESSESQAQALETLRNAWPNP